MEEAPLRFNMKDRKEITVRDRAGHYCLVRQLDEAESETHKLKMTAEAEADDQQLPVVPGKKEADP